MKLEIYLINEGCDLSLNTHIWQFKELNSSTWINLQTGSDYYKFDTFTGGDGAFRVRYMENGCVKFSNIAMYYAL
jgi:hypothetical protein